MVKGISHITLAVMSVEDSCRFYTDVLGCRLIARWPEGAYLAAGDTWLALVSDPETRKAALPEYTHIAFSIDGDDFPRLSQRVEDSGMRIWKSNESEGASLYFEDPNGHKLEIHVGDLKSRLDSARRNPWSGLELLDPDS